MNKRLARTLLVFALVLVVIGVGGCATKSQSGGKVNQPKNNPSHSGEPAQESESDDDSPPPPPPPTY